MLSLTVLGGEEDSGSSKDGSLGLIWDASQLSSPQPWEADLGAMDPFMFDAEDYDDEEDDMAWSEGGMDYLEEEETDGLSNEKQDQVARMDALAERALRFYEQYNGVREKEKCFLVGMQRKRRDIDEVIHRGVGSACACL